MKFVRVDADGLLTAFINLANVTSVEFEDGNCIFWFANGRSVYLEGAQAAKAHTYMQHCSGDLRPEAGNIREQGNDISPPFFGSVKWGGE